MLRALDRYVAKLETFLALVSGLGLAALVVLITMDVLGRNLGVISLPWTVEFSQYWLIAGTFLSAGWIYREMAHPRISVIDELSDARLAFVLRMLATALTIGAALFGLIFMTEIVLAQMQRGISVGTYVRVPRWIVLSPIVIGFATLLYEAVCEVLPHRRAKKSEV